MNYQEFINRKKHDTNFYGFEPVWMPDFLYDFQKHIVEWNLKKGKSATFADTGLGKTPIQLVFAQNIVEKTNKNCLLLTPLAVSHQTIKEAEKFGIDAKRSRDGKPAGKLTITNYQQLEKFDMSDFNCIVCDESSAIKSSTSQTRKNITRAMAKMKYRLLCTATPSPNDFIELGTSAEALGEMQYMEMLDAFFRDTSNDKNPQWSTPKYELKKHAIKDFWRWVSTWALAVRMPSDLGYNNDRFILPELIEKEHILKCTKPLPGMLFVDQAKSLKQQREERKLTINERCEKVTELCEPNKFSVVWAHYNYETDLLNKMIPNSVNISGADSDESKEEKFLAFSNGEIKTLITKPKIGAWGLNWQHCNHTVFFPSHCYDEKTEILTISGWKRFKNVTYQDVVATINQNSLDFEWQYPTEIINNPYSGEMVKFSNNNSYSKSFDLLVTPNHKMFVQKCPTRYKQSDGEWELIRADNIQKGFKRQEYRMLSCAMGFKGSDVESVRIPEYTQKETKFKNSLNKNGDNRGMSKRSIEGLIQRNTITVEKISIDSFLKLAGWYLSEGCCGSRNGVLDGQIRITQTDYNPKYRKEIISLLEGIDEINVYKKNKDIRFCSKQVATYLVSEFGNGSYQKKIPKWIKNLPKFRLEILRDTMLKGDGCSQKKGGEKFFYRTVSLQLAEDFLEICLKTGYRGSIKFRKNKDKKGGCYDVTIAKKNIRPYIHQEPKIVEYSGMIGCVSVPNRTIIVRRNGIPVVCGNSFEMYYQGVRRFHRYGQKNSVTVDIVTTEGERNVLKNIKRKANDMKIMFAELVKNMNSEYKRKDDINFNRELIIPEWIYEASERGAA